MNQTNIIAISFLYLTSLTSARPLQHEHSVWRYERMPYGPPPPPLDTNPFYGPRDRYGKQASIIGAYRVEVPDSDPADGLIFLITFLEGGVTAGAQANGFRSGAFGQWSRTGPYTVSVIDAHTIYSTSDPYSVMAVETDIADLTIHEDGSLTGDVFVIQRNLEDMVILEAEIPILITPLPRPVNKYRSSQHRY
eukprot:GHVN01103288.1.p1 GENE.GHVN01103288.1~~GHVN01103288.1.p1  ORF type:complete len:193 (+),score=26.06 GHVN01103288.1:44-622(+)